MSERDICGRVRNFIALFEKTGLDEDKKLATLYRKLRETRSARLFEARVREIAAQVRSLYRSNDDDGERVTSAVTCGLLIETFLRHVDDSGIVAEILKCLESEADEYDFVLLADEVLGLKLPPEVVEQRTRMGLKSFNFLSYFLDHANESRLVLCGQRFISLMGSIHSVSVSRDERKKTLFHMPSLLQYGVSLGDRRQICSSYVPPPLVSVLREIIEYGYLHYLWEGKTMSFLVEPAQFDSTMKDLCLCFRDVLRDVKNPHEATFFVAGCFYSKSWLSRESRLPDLEILLPFYEKLFPGCFYGQRTVPSLQHMCRYVIRQQLYNNWKIPSGIDHLLLPDILKDYINERRDYN